MFARPSRLLVSLSLPPWLGLLVSANGDVSMMPDSQHMGSWERTEDGSVGTIVSTQAAPTHVGTHQTTLAGPKTKAPSIGSKHQPTSRTINQVNAFPMGDIVLIRHYFESEGVFALLSPYYNEREFRFEVPRTEFESVREAASARGTELTPIEDATAFAVVVKKYREHPETVFSESVAQFSADGYNVFVMKNSEAVDTAVDEGAIHLSDVPITVRFPPGYRTGPLTVRDVS